MHSCIYEGFVRHGRLKPVTHGFRYRLFLLYLDLDELPGLLRGGSGISPARFAPFAFRREDHLGEPGTPLQEGVRDLVAARTGRRPAGPIRLLTLPRNFGYYFCPLCLYYCLDPAGQRTEVAVAEVSNTPWLEKHWYVLGDANRVGRPGALQFRHPKEFHVSPFMDMNAEYQWRLSEPGSRLCASIVTRREGERFFWASLVLRRRELSHRAMLGTLLRFPWMTARVVQAIHFQALRLWWKQCPYYPHPKHRKPAATAPK